MARKSEGKKSKLSYSGSPLVENRNGLIVNAEVFVAKGTAERDAALVMLERIPAGMGRLLIAKGFRSDDILANDSDMRCPRLCETCGLYFPDHKIFKSDTYRAVVYCSTLLGRGIQRRALSQQPSLAEINEQYRREPLPAKALRLPRICVGKTSHPISTRGGLQRAHRKRAASARQILLSSRNESRRQSPQNKWRDAVSASASRRDGESSLPSK